MTFNDSDPLNNRDLLTRSRTDTQRQKGKFCMCDKSFDGVRPLKQKLRDLRRTDVADVEPQHLRGRTTQHTQLNEVFILGDQHAHFSHRNLPQLNVRSAAQPKNAHMQRVGKTAGKRGNKTLRQILVEKKSNGH